MPALIEQISSSTFISLKNYLFVIAAVIVVGLFLFVAIVMSRIGRARLERGPLDSGSLVPLMVLLQLRVVQPRGAGLPRRRAQAHGWRTVPVLRHLAQALDL